MYVNYQIINMEGLILQGITGNYLLLILNWYNYAGKQNKKISRIFFSC